MHRVRPRRKPMSEINVVPYIDVMLVLLVIFMITAPLLTQGVKVELPQASAEPLPPEALEPLVVTVDAGGRYYLNVGGAGEQEPIDAETLANRVAAVLRHQPQTPVMVRGDRQVEYGQVIGVMVALTSAGAPSVGLITEPPPGPGPGG
ncbi:MAG TPA: protein TolR [Gammaproteobacteria bacterium]